MNKYIHSVLILLICFSCKEKIKDNTYAYTLKKIDKDIVLPVDSVTNNFSFGMFLFSDQQTGIEYLSMENDQTDEINIYQLDTRKLINKIPIQRTGPNAVGRLSGHKMNNPSDIFVLVSERNLLARVDLKGQVLEKIALQSEKEHLRPYSARSVNYCPMVSQDSCLYFVQAPARADINKKEFSGSPVCIEYNFKKKEAKSLPLTYADFFKRITTPISITDIGRTDNGTDFIYTFSGFDDLMVTSDHIKPYFHKITSRYMKPTTEQADYSSIENEVRFFCEKAYYGPIIYDKYRKVYYRFAYLESEMPKGINIMKARIEFCKPFSIITINSKFEVIGETLFPKNMYVTSMTFINKNGLYIATSNYYNPEYNEDILKFECFELVKE